jgi:VanZ family protein
MTRRVPPRRIVLWIMTVLMLAFIFGQSLLPQDVSAEESGWILNNILNPVLNALGLGSLSHQTARKLAHVAEFTALSALLVFCFRGSFAKAFSGGFVTAFLDESLQLLTARGAQLQDVWIDLIGVLSGVLIGLLVRRLLTLHGKHVEENHS